MVDALTILARLACVRFRVSVRACVRMHTSMRARRARVRAFVPAPALAYRPDEAVGGFEVVSPERLLAVNVPEVKLVRPAQHAAASGEGRGESMFWR